MLRVIASSCVLIALAATPARAADPPAKAAEQPAKRPQVHFKKIVLDRAFRSEGVAVGDFNHDGRLDIAAGNVYYAAPDWKMTPMEGKPRAFPPKGYSDSFVNYALDVNGDGWTDLVVIGFPGQPTWWLENPGPAGGLWKRHLLTPVTNNESPQMADVDGDGRLALVCGVNSDTKNPDGPGRTMAILRPHSNPLLPWKIQSISAPGAPNTTKFSHGLGIGDINGDGRADIVVPQGWWEAPPKTNRDSASDAATKGGQAAEPPRRAAQGTPEWKFHPAPLGEASAHMVVYDFAGNGRNSVVSSSAHAYGLWWHEQTATGWKTHLIDRSFSQSHSLCLADINGDGLPDLVTGKRWWAHASGDPGVNEPAVLVWYELSRAAGRPVWTPHTIDNDSGVGTQFQVIDVNGDGLPDIVVANKKGVFLFLQVRG